MLALHCLLCCISVLTKPAIVETSHEFVLQNGYMQVGISKNQGLITTITLGTNHVLDGTCSLSYQKQVSETYQVIQSTTRSTPDGDSEILELVTECNKDIVFHRYTIDTVAFRWDVAVNYHHRVDREKHIAFSLPIAKNLEEIQNYGHEEQFESKKIGKTILTYRHDLFVPMITGYSPSRNYGLSIVAPLEVPKPNLQFAIDKSNYIVSFNHMQVGSNNDVKAAIYIVPHEGDWRPGLGFLLERYPEYFYPTNASKIRDGWYYLSYPDRTEKQISAYRDRGVEWIEFTAFFPFYGLYIPHLADWGIIFDSDNTGIDQWEAGAGTKRISIQKMRDFIQLWHKYGIQVYLYYQTAEAWHQYARKYFGKGIAIDRKGVPLRAYLFTHLMNPDPYGDWGKYIIDQARKILKTFPEIDGIFYDRIDYKDYDFGHDDGITMIDDRPAYMLAFGQEKINTILFDLFHKKGKAIWGNVPTSIEVCKNLDGIMAEKNLRYLQKLQYLGLARPIIYLPYDGLPHETEEKLKNALIYGATIAVTYGGKEAQNIESKYKTIFGLLQKREWVLNASCLKIRDGLKGNIYRTPDSNYVVIIVSPDKFQVKNHPFEYNIPITVDIQDAEHIKHAYFLSGDWRGMNKIAMKREGRKLRIVLPYHLTTSVIYLTKKEEFEVVRVSPPILIRGNSNKIIFKIHGNTHQHNIELRTPWTKERRKIRTDNVEFDIAVPESAVGEIDIVIAVDGREFLFSNWVVDPVSLAPRDEIFIHHREGEDVQFYISNNLPRPISLNLNGTFSKNTGSIEAPHSLTLAPFETKLIQLHITAESSDNAILKAPLNNKQIVWPIRVNTNLAFSQDDLFHDDFTGGMEKWTILAGTWNTSMNKAQVSGPTHFACVFNDDWRDYVLEATVRCRGSSKPTIDWLKSYIFFRVQDEHNYYRFGIQGDAGVLSLYKRANGKWRKIHTTPFIPKKDKWYTLQVQIKGTRITCFIENKRVMAFDDEAFSSGGIGIGVLEDAQICDYKNVIVRNLQH